MAITSLKYEEDLLLVAAYNRVRSARLKLSNPSENLEAFYDRHPILAKAARKFPETWQSPKEVWDRFQKPEQAKLAIAADAIRQQWTA